MVGDGTGGVRGVGVVADSGSDEGSTSMSTSWCSVSRGAFEGRMFEEVFPTREDGVEMWRMGMRPRLEFPEAWNVEFLTSCKRSSDGGSRSMECLLEASGFVVK